MKRALKNPSIGQISYKKQTLGVSILDEIIKLISPSLHNGQKWEKSCDVICEWSQRHLCVLCPFVTTDAAVLRKHICRCHEAQILTKLCNFHD